MRLFARSTVLLVAGVLTAGVSAKQPVAPAPERPFGTLREQAAMQQDWLRKRLDTFLPALMRKHGIDIWVVPMREYNEDPVFSRSPSPETFAARRRTIYVFFDKCAAAGTPPSAACVERIALGGTSQGGVFDARRSTKAAARKHRTRAAGRALGRRAVAGAQGRDRGAQAEGHRHRSLDRLRVLRRPVERRAAGHDRRRSAASGRRGSATPRGCRSS